MVPNSVREMDIGWYDKSLDILWLVELKAFFDPDNPKHQPKDLSIENIRKEVLEELLLKSIHSVSMICGNRSGTAVCWKGMYKHSSKIKLVHLMRFLPEQDTLYTDQLANDLQAKFKPYKHIFKVDSIQVLDYDYIRNKGLLDWVV
jgi:hypothetical protein